MKVHVLKPILHDKLGGLKPGKVVEMQDAQAQEYLKRGAVEQYETKVVREHPLPLAGADTPSSASPVAQVSQVTTAKKSKTGGRKKKAEQ